MFYLTPPRHISTYTVKGRIRRIAIVALARKLLVDQLTSGRSCVCFSYGFVPIQGEPFACARRSPHRNAITPPARACIASLPITLPV
jgi:hypothetical protein